MWPFFLVLALTFTAGFLTHWRLARRQRQELKYYRQSARAAYAYAPGRR